jgi:hypothetical protein
LCIYRQFNLLAGFGILKGHDTLIRARRVNLVRAENLYGDDLLVQRAQHVQHRLEIIIPPVADGDDEASGRQMLGQGAQRVDEVALIAGLALVYPVKHVVGPGRAVPAWRQEGLVAFRHGQLHAIAAGERNEAEQLRDLLGALEFPTGVRQHRGREIERDGHR